MCAAMQYRLLNPWKHREVANHFSAFLRTTQCHCILRRVRAFLSFDILNGLFKGGCHITLVLINTADEIRVYVTSEHDNGSRKREVRARDHRFVINRGNNCLKCER